MSTTHYECGLMVVAEEITRLSDGVLVRAPAKINLSLLVAGKRADGFHEIESLMAKVNWYDEILILPRKNGGIMLDCEGPYEVPGGRDNLVYKACEMLLKQFGLSANIQLVLRKKIPAGSGLGSGSSDAAAVLKGLIELLDININAQKLSEIAACLGSDVPFFLDGPVAFCRGKGEKVTKLPKIFEFRALLLLPDISVSTQKVYENYYHDETLFKSLHEQINLLMGKNSIDLVARMCANMLQISCFQLYGELAELKKAAEAVGIKPICLSGSGSSMFYIFNESEHARLQGVVDVFETNLNCKTRFVTNNTW